MILLFLDLSLRDLYYVYIYLREKGNVLEAALFTWYFLIFFTTSSPGEKMCWGRGWSFYYFYRFSCKQVAVNLDPIVILGLPRRQRTSRTSSERLMYVQFTSCVYGLGHSSIPKCFVKGFKEKAKLETTRLFF